MPLGVEQLSAVVLAGGFGTRIKHLLPGVPKPMAPVAGKPFLEWVVRYLARQGVREVVLSTGYLANVIEDYFRAEPVCGMRVRCAPETEPLGTAGGFLNAARAFGEAPAAWLVLNGDSLAFADLSQAAAQLRVSGVDGVLVGARVPDASRYGTLAVGPDGALLGFAEKHPGAGVINAGMYLLRDRLVREFPPARPLSFEQDVFPRLTARGAALRVVATEAPFLDIGTPESLRLAEDFVRQNRTEFE